MLVPRVRAGETCAVDVVRSLRSLPATRQFLVSGTAEVLELAARGAVLADDMVEQSLVSFHQTRSRRGCAGLLERRAGYRGIHETAVPLENTLHKAARSRQPRRMIEYTSGWFRYNISRLESIRVPSKERFPQSHWT